MNSTINQNSSISSETIPIEKKKRGRKKQNVALEVKEEPVVEVVKPHPKKRGRKPKGGKIIQQTDIIHHKSTNEPSVILHLRCSLKDIEDTNNCPTNYKYNPSIESIQSFQFDNSNIDNFLIEQNASNNTDNIGYNGTNVECINTAHNLNPDVNNNYNSNSTYNVTMKTDDGCSKMTTATSSKNDIADKLNTLKTNLHHNNIYDKRSACFWCTCDFDNQPCFIPKNEFKNSYQVYGCFCSPECSVAHLMNEKIDSSIKFERYQLLNHIYGKAYNYSKNIKPAPNPHYLLDKFYGTLTIKEYRDLFKTEQLLIVVEKPLTHVFPELYEDNADFILNQRTIPSNSTFNLKKKVTATKKTGVFEPMTVK